MSVENKSPLGRQEACASHHQRQAHNCQDLNSGAMESLTGSEFMRLMESSTDRIKPKISFF